MPLVTRTSVSGNVYRQATEPSDWLNGDLWVDTDNGFLYVNVSGTATQVGAATVTDAIYGDGSDGDVTISSNTDLTTANYKQYENLTIDATFELTANTPLFIRVSETLTLNGTITMSEKGGAGGSGFATAGNGATAGGMVYVFAKTITGTGSILANGGNGTNATEGTTNGNGTNGSAGVNDNGNLTAPDYGDGGTGDTGSNIAGGGGGGAGYANGGDGGTSAKGAGGAATAFRDEIRVGSTYGAGGGGGGSSQDGAEQDGKRTAGGGGGGAGFIVIVSDADLPACTISANGGNGGNGYGDAFGGAGGGGGGGCVLKYLKPDATDGSTTTVTGGTRGNHGGGSGDGQNGTAGQAFTIRLR